jgi:hypothetical protein
MTVNLMISSQQLKDELRNRWPDLQWIWPTNPYWSIISNDWLDKIIENCSVRHFKTIKGIWECENYAYQWKANVEKYQYELYDSGEYQPKWRWAVGECLGMQAGLFGGVVVHSVNVLRTEDGIKLFEPQEDKVGIDDFTPFFVKF